MRIHLKCASTRAKDSNFDISKRGEKSKIRKMEGLGKRVSACLAATKDGGGRNEAIDKSFLSTTERIIDVPLIFIVSRTPISDGNGYQDFSVRRYPDKKTGSSSGR